MFRMSCCGRKVVRQTVDETSFVPCDADDASPASETRVVEESDDIVKSEPIINQELVAEKGLPSGHQHIPEDEAEETSFSDASLASDEPPQASSVDTSIVVWRNPLDEFSQQTTTSYQESPNESLMNAVLPILWNFLLESGNRSVDRDPETDALVIDLKSISSLFLVNHTASNSFHECNGRMFLVKALKEESYRRARYADVNYKRIRKTFRGREWSDSGTHEEKQMVESFLNQLHSLSRTMPRIRHILETLSQCLQPEWDEDEFPAASSFHVAGITSGIDRELSSVSNKRMDWARRDRDYYLQLDEDERRMLDWHIEMEQQLAEEAAS